MFVFIGDAAFPRPEPEGRRSRRLDRAPRSLPPLSLCWDGVSVPLPRRLVRPIGKKAATLPAHAAAPPWLVSGPVEAPFDFCGAMERLIGDVAARSPALRHVNPKCILIATMQARRSGPAGLQARVTPLRFAQGKLTRKRRGHTFQVQRYFVNGHEYLYLMTFCLPRYLEQDFDGKLITLFHELYHIGPNCDGDLRRHEGRYRLHTHSQKEYDRHMAQLARDYLSSRPDPDLHAFLRLSYAQLQQRHGGVVGVVVPRPKVVPLVEAAHTAPPT